MTDTTMAYPGSDPRHLGMAGAVAHGGPAPKRIVTGYGFWIFILSDMVMFSAFFATYAVLLGQTAGGPSGHDLFDLRNVAIETGFLLASSFTCGLASIAPIPAARSGSSLAMAVTCAFGLGFLAIEGQGIRRSRRARRRTDAQRVPVGVLHAGGLPRAARLGRHPVAADDDGAGFRQGVQAGHPAPHPVLCAVLARARHHLDRRVHRGVFAGKRSMTNGHDEAFDNADVAPGDEHVEGGVGTSSGYSAI